MSHERQSRVIAVLGPTNTGKTHYAMERLLAHSDGMIGFPLRLLARENYERAVRKKGRAQVALMTGEEKIVPPGARYFMCTVEAMPVHRSAAFIAIDEVQMAADAERGHAFTDRILHARGRQETLLLGAETAKPVIRSLVPDAQFIGRARLSTLRYRGVQKVTRLPPRSAVVAFSTADVYALAELIRQQRGGSAVVLGALSPRTRNAQVAMFQAGEVDYLVATDAIGMGLNMDVDHVAFARTRKFDGQRPRALTAAEMGQIAGRAGRHMNDGTFGATAEVGPLDPELIERIENHRFDPLRHLMWRSNELDFRSIDTLQKSLNAPPPRPGLVRAREADDERVLGILASDPDVTNRATNPHVVRLLWDVCGIPDFRKVASDGHARLLKSIFLHLAGADGRLPADWLAHQVNRLDRTDGDIETLTQRVAGVRTWTFVSHNTAWLDDAAYWQERSREVEDRLSDALHDRLLNRFVDRRTSMLTRKNATDRTLAPVVALDGAVRAAGFLLGQVEGLQFQAAKEQGGDAFRRTLNIARTAAASDISRRARELADEDDSAFALGDDGTVSWRQMPVARLVQGQAPWRPAVALLAAPELAQPDRALAERRLAAWLAGSIESELSPIVGQPSDQQLSGAVRGLLFQLAEGLGTVDRAVADGLVRSISSAERQLLKARGIRIGRAAVFAPRLLRPAAIRKRALLWNTWSGSEWAAPQDGRVSIEIAEGAPAAFYSACGFRPCGRLAVRVDMLERVAAMAWNLSETGAFSATCELMSLASVNSEDLGDVLGTLGYRRIANGEPRFARARPQGKRQRRTPDPGQSPFAKLVDLLDVV